MKNKNIKIQNIICIVWVILFASTIDIYSQNNNFFNDNTLSKPKQTKSTNKSNIELYKRYVKLGNTYREGGNYNKAFYYLSAAKINLEKKRNSEEKYWYAAANEGLGFYYRDINDIPQAQQYFNVAMQIYQDILTQDDGSQNALIDAMLNIKQASKKHHPKDNNFDNGIATFLNNGNLGKKIENALQQYLPQYFEKDNKNNLKNAEVHTFTFGNNGLENFPHSKEFYHSNNSAGVENFSGMNLTDFPSDYTETSINTLDISNNNIATFPPRIFTFGMIEYLDISNNKISNFPSLNSLNKLQYLNIANNQLSEISNSIGELRHLNFLDVSNNPNLSVISRDIFKLKNTLKILDISGTNLPQSFIDELLRKMPNTNIKRNNIKAGNTKTTPAPRKRRFNLEDEDEDEDDD
jgi:Leucine-rich repeat (LRR) protein